MADHYFAVAGYGAGTGADVDNPETFSTVNFAAIKAGVSAGDIIYFLDGDYNHTPDFRYFANSVTLKSLNVGGAKFYIAKVSGDALQELYFWPNANTILTFDGLKFENMKPWIASDASKWCILKNCTIYTTTDLTSAGRGIMRQNGGGTNTVHDCSFNYISAETNTLLIQCAANFDFQRCSFNFDLSNHSASLATIQGFSNSTTLKNCIMSADSSTYINPANLDFANVGVNCCVHNMGALNDQGGGTGDGTNNVFADPQFVNPTTGDLRLRPSSPCINAGA